MPGRQAHGRPLLANPNKKRKSGKGGGGNGASSGGSGGAPSGARSSGGAPRTRQGGRVDVMAMAEKQIGESRMKGVRMRDLQIEREPTKRRRHDDDDDDDEDDDEDNEGDSKRRRPNNAGDSDGSGSEAELHSDSDGNEWREGVGGDDEDSEIDSDEAFGESDDDMFDAFSFRGSSSNQQQQKKKAKAKAKSQAKRQGNDEFDGFDNPSDFSDEDAGDDGAELGDDAIDLAAALDIVSSDEEEGGAEGASSRKDKSRKKSKAQKAADNSDMSDASASSSVSGSDSDGSGSESDDYSGSDSDSDEDEDEDDEDEAVFNKSDALKSIASAYAAGQRGDDSDAEDDSDMEVSGPASANPYQFSAATFASKDRSLKKSLKSAVAPSSEKTLNVPLLPMQQDRQLRAAAAEKSHETLDRWTDTVKHNRRAEHITFEVAGSLASSGLDTTSLVPINHKSAQTDLERTILSIMEESGLGPKAKAEEQAQEKARKEKELAENGPPVLSPDELKALINQKRRARDLQSQETARAKRIKKIKSKAFRRVHRRERQRAEDALMDSDAEQDSGDDLDSEAEREKHHRQRALERMGSRHRDSKWAKRAKNTNRAAWDDEFRAGIVEMARQDEELRRRVEGAGVGGNKVHEDGNDSDGDSDSYGDESDEEVFKLRTKQKLEGLSGKNGAEDEPKGLMGIAFMRKAEEARKKANDDAVAEILRDLNRASDDEDDDAVLFGDDKERNGAADGDDEPVVGRRTYGPAANGQKNNARTRQRKLAAAEERREQDDELTTATAADAASAPENNFAEDVSRTTLANKVSAPGDAGSWTVVANKANNSKSNKKTKTSAAATAGTAGLTSDGRLVIEAVMSDVLEQNKVAEENAANAAANAALVKSTNAAKRAKAPVTLADGAESDTSTSGSDSEDDAAPRSTGNRRGNADAVQFKGRNEKLLLKALGEDYAAAEFAAEKAQLAAEEADAWEEEHNKSKKGNATLPGWGSWIGDGISKRAAKRDSKNVPNGNGSSNGKAKDKKNDKVEKLGARKDAKLDRVIISERRMRKTEKYMASRLPHEFENRSQYERSLRLPVGPEWSTTFAFQDATKPRVLKKQGIVLPMAKPLL